MTQKRIDHLERAGLLIEAVMNDDCTMQDEFLQLWDIRDAIGKARRDMQFMICLRQQDAAKRCRAKD
jgi:hypothetical protein